LQLAELHMTKKSRFWGSRFEAKNSSYGSSTAYRGKPLILEEKIPYGCLFVCPTQGVSPNRRFHRRQRFIRTHNETLFVVAMGGCNPDRSPVGLQR
jgi:hypothetical protein